MKQLSLLTLLISSLLFVTCKKDDVNPNPLSAGGLSSCGTNSGLFEFTVDGVNHDANFVAGDQFTIIYNYFGDSITNFGVYANDQNGTPIYFGLAYPGNMHNGITTVNENTSIDFGLEISIDTTSLYMKEVTFDISTAVLSPTDGVYRPIIGTFSGMAHSYPWFNGQAPADTFLIEGSFCLNGLILP